jgi:transcriptional regulator with XRE-family HTH domain
LKQISSRFDSQIERKQINLGISPLERIAQTTRIPVTQLFPDPTQPIPYRRR